jgi:hypothetical protein
MNHDVLAPLYRVDAEPNPIDSLDCARFEIKGVQGGCSGSGIYLRLDRRQSQGRNCDPFAPADDLLFLDLYR